MSTDALAPCGHDVPLRQPKPDAEASLDSFVVRFVRRPDCAPGPAASWHGLIRHVQSSRERAFNRWADAVAFINEFVDVAEVPCHE